jgi:micrococcal nuclease
MRFAKRIGIAGAVWLAACGGPVRLAAHADWPPPPRDAVRSHVERVVDGDTVILSGFGRARLIGVDTPEVHGADECYGREASAFTKRTIGGHDVLVSFDVDHQDRYRRALVYLWVDRMFFNAALVAEGYAQQLTVPPNVRFAELFSGLVGEARQRHRGLWGDACRG